MDSMSYGPGSFQETHRGLQGGQDHRGGTNTVTRISFGEVKLIARVNRANAGHIRQSEVWSALPNRRAGCDQGKNLKLAVSARTPFANGSFTHCANDAAYSCLGTSRIAAPADRAATKVRLLL